MLLKTLNVEQLDYYQEHYFSVSKYDDDIRRLDRRVFQLPRICVGSFIVDISSEKACLCVDVNKPSKTTRCSLVSSELDTETARSR